MGENVLIVGAGSGLSAAFARRLRREGFDIALASRNIDKLDGLVAETDAKCFPCDCSDP
ncbi:MAG TPA: oxidoreductase, partial [Rhodospirillaceae bacterium]|nr:oxidoreductase [Rhodospirillaceae bacterium]